MNEVYIAVTRTDGSVAHYAFQCKGRFFKQPLGGWEKADETLWRKLVRFVTRDPWTTWLREPTEANILYDLDRLNRSWANRVDETGKSDPDALMVRWRMLTQAEHEAFERDRTYRDAMVDDGALSHDMVKARALHRAHLRHLNGDRFMTMDREWLDAAASGDTAKAAEVEAKRRYYREFVNDPRIDAAQTLAELKTVLPDESR
jgi:hypothetical protein